VWTSLGQDGSREGIFGQFVAGDGSLAGGEFRVNTTTIGQQLHGAVVSDGSGRFLAVWSSYVSGTRFDVFGQRYAASQVLPQLPPPYMAALNSLALGVAWPQLAGYNVTSYGGYVDGSSTPVNVTSNYYVLAGLAPGSTHSVRIDYLLADGRRPSPSAPATGTTWGADNNFDGLPDDWQALYWGPNSSAWPAGNVDSDGDGVTNVQEFLAGTNPTDSNSALRMQLVSTPQGWQLQWNTQPGFLYQVQVSADFSSWANYGPIRFAASSTDSVAVNPPNGTAYYRLIRVR